MNSHLISVIYTNGPPSPIQKRQIKGLIAALKDNVIELDEEIARAQAKREIRLRQIHTYEAALSPCRRLPPELVSEVFLYAQHNYIVRPANSLRLSQICSAWRETAVNIPGLWTNISIEYGRKSYAKKMLLLKMFCSRASGHPLSVRIDGTRLPPNVDDPISILSPYIKTIKSLTLDVPFCFAQSLYSLPPDSFPLLENFRFMSTDGGPTTLVVDLPIHGPFSSAHHLWDFDFRVPFQGETLHLPEQLTHVTLEDITCAQALSALRHCPHIIEFCGRFSERGAPFPSVPIVFPNMRSLDITIGNQVDLDDIIDHLTIPALKSLRIRSWEYEDVQITPSFALFVTRSSCAPTELDIGCLEMTDIGFLEIVRLLPSLVIIRLEAIDFMEDSVYGALVYKDDDSILPKLEDLTIHSLNCTPTDELILEVAKSRWRPRTETQEADASNPNMPSRPKRFIILVEGRTDERDVVHQNVRDELARLVEEGFAIDLHFQI